MILSRNNAKNAKKFFEQIIDIGIDFKTKENIADKSISISEGKKIITEIPRLGKPLQAVLNEFKKDILPYCTNFSSPRFMGFPDSGNSVAAIGGAILYTFLQQNLINQSFCGPSATFVDIAVIKWLRQVVGYKNKAIKNIWDVGGIITPGGTGSNAVAMMLARENMFPETMESGIKNTNTYVVVPKGIGHYSVKSAQMWMGCGNKLIEVETKNFKYNLVELKKKLNEFKGQIMCVVVYVGDSRSMTIDDLNKILNIVKESDPKIWLHADACHGFSLGFSDKLKSKIKGIEKFDSISTDPHKVLMTPYTISALLIKDPEKFKNITSLSDLIMQEDFAFGQITPFLGSRPWTSLKLWFLIKNLGKDKIGKIIEKRHNLAVYLSNKLKTTKDFVVLNEVGINSVIFMYKGLKTNNDIDDLNRINKSIHNLMLQEGQFHLHQFSIVDDGLLEKSKILYPLRYMCGNPNTTKKDINELIEYVRKLGRRLEEYGKE
jgi:L-2,4-diaminobutyrate decarboxylase